MSLDLTTIFKKTLCDDGFRYQVDLVDSGHNVPGYYMTVPTANCQVGSIYNIQGILDIENNLNMVYDSDNKKITSQMVLKYYKLYLGMKPQILVDVHRTYEIKLENIFPQDSIVFKQQYTSTNGSLMTMYLLKTDFLENLAI